MRKIQIVPLSRKEEMRKYFYQYMKELSEFDKDISFNEAGEPIYKWFDFYWTEKKRYPIYLLVDDKVAGFSLIRELEACHYEVAEFYVLPQFRKEGNALFLAEEIVKLFEGQFDFSTCLTNTRAIKFWTKFAKLYSQGNFFDDEKCRNWTIRGKI